MSVLREIQPSYRAVYYVPLSQIHSRPFAKRSDEDDGLLGLAASIRRHGLLQPVTVRPVGDGYEIVLGERRFRACLMLGFSYIDAFILQAAEKDAALYSLLENTGQQPLHYFDLAEACAVLRAGGMPSDAIARQMGESPEWVERKTALLGLDEKTRAFIRESGLSERHARALLPLPDAEAQLSLARRAARLRLSPRETEALAEKEMSRGGMLPQRKIISMVWDPRLYVNAIYGILSQMRESGIDARTSVLEDDAWVTLNIKIRKRS